MFALRHVPTMIATACLLAGCGAPVPKTTASTTASADAAAAQDSDAQASMAADAQALPAINCGEGQLAAFMNQAESNETRAAVAAAVGHRPIRWIHPGDAVTMDYQPGRLNIIVDEQGHIASTRCG
jgi:hypothetical protein